MTQLYKEKPCVRMFEEDKPKYVSPQQLDRKLDRPRYDQKDELIHPQNVFNNSCGNTRL